MNSPRGHRTQANMRILHVITTLDPAAGGPPMVATRLAAALARQGHEVSLFAYDSPGKQDAVRKMLAGVPGMDAVRTITTPPGGTLERIFAGGARRSLPAVVKTHDIVHAHGVWDPILPAACGVARSLRVPYVITPHGMLDPWSMAQSAAKKLKKKIALAVQYRSMLNGAAFLHWLNRDERDLAAPVGIAAPGEVIGNGIFPEELADPPPKGTFRAKVPGLGDAPYALFMARLHYKKGLDYLADAMGMLANSLPALHAVVAGPDDGARGDFERRVRERGAESRVHVVGPLYGADKLAALVDANMFVLPSRQEGFSIAITEAMACGLPVVVSDACHFPEVAEFGCGFVIPLDAKSLADRMRDLLADPTRSVAMGEAGRRLVFERFTWPQVARQMADAYARARR